MLFLYGTLLSQVKHPSHEMIEKHCQLISNAETRGALYDVGEFPALIKTKGDRYVKGELYEILNEDELFYVLDYYEGCSIDCPTPHLYKREKITVHLTDGTKKLAWTYFFNQDTSHLNLIESGDYVQYLKAKT